METTLTYLTFLGVVLLIGLLMSILAKKLRIPNVLLLILSGIALANIKYEEAQELASTYCKEKVISHRLTHKGQLLFYRSYTKNCEVEINALDGALISKVYTYKGN